MKYTYHQRTVCYYQLSYSEFIQTVSRLLQSNCCSVVIHLLILSLNIIYEVIAYSVCVSSSTFTVQLRFCLMSITDVGLSSPIIAGISFHVSCCCRVFNTVISFNIPYRWQCLLCSLKNCQYHCFDNRNSNNLISKGFTFPNLQYFCCTSQVILQNFFVYKYIVL